MNIPTTQTNFASAAWLAFFNIQQTVETSFTWVERLEKINTILLDTLDIKALWLLTISPLPSTACGLIKTPLAGALDAHVQIIDQAPPPIEEWPSDSSVRQVITSQQPYFFQTETNKADVDLGDVLFGTFQAKPTIIVPLLAQNQAMGVLVVASTHLAIDATTEAVMAQLGHLIGGHLHQAIRLERTEERIHTLAIENADLLKSIESRSLESSKINQVSLAINAGHGLTETAKLIYEQFRRLFEFEHLSISLVDELGQNVRVWIFNRYGCNRQADLITTLKNSSLAELLNQSHGRIYKNILLLKKQGTLYADDQLLLQDDIKSKMAVPFKTAKGLYGSLNLGYRSANKYITSELTLLEQLTPQVAMMIEHGRLIDAMEQHTNKLQMLNRLGEMLLSLTELDRIVEITLSMLPRLLPGDVQAVIISSEEGTHLGVAIPYNFNRTQKTIIEIVETFEEVIDKKAIEVTSTKTIAGNMPVSSKWEPQTVLSLPILTRQGTAGLIYIASGEETPLDNDLLRIFSLVVSQVSAVVENANLFRQVEQESARLAAILSSSTDAILVVQRNGRIVLDNPAAWAVLGVDKSQRGKPLTEATSNKILISLFEGAMQGQKPNGEIPLDDGRTLFANLSPVSIGNKGIIGWIATMQDVSYFKELNDLKNDFVNAVSHDLRSPLSSILIATHLMTQTGPANEMQKDLLGTIEKKVKTMSRLIHDLLDVGKIEAGIDIDLKPVMITPIIQDVIFNLMSQAEQKEMKLSGDIAPDLPPMQGNETRLQQVFHNLVGNAIKYTPEHGQVTVKAFLQDNEIRVEIADNGLGIPAADQPHIFEKFYRVRGEHVKSIKGTGLGLAITKGIVEKHNGRIWLESVFGEGSTFIIALPLGN